MFWGLTLEPGKRYAQEVQNSFHISMAALDITNSKENNVATMVEVEKNEFVMCTLNKSHTMQQPIDLNFMKGTQVAFFTQGKGSVHLTGFLIPDEDAFGDFDEEEEESSDEEAPQLQLAKSAKNVLDKKRKGEPAAEKVSPASKKLKAMAQQIMNGEDLDSEDDEDDEDFEDDDSDDDEDGKGALFDAEAMEDTDDEEEEEGEEEEDEDDDDDDESEDEETEVPVKQGKQKTPQKQQQQQQQKTPNSQKKQNGAVTPKEQSAKKGDKQTPKQSPNNKDAKAQGTPGSKKTLHGGVVIEEINVGNGPAAATGKQVAVYYVGRNKHNNKQFDATQSGPPFKFRLGKGDVIKGWDIGVQGMKVGGKRRVICPPHMAYGNKGSPPVIPPNSTLVFDIELKGVS